MTPDTALRLERLLGVTAGFWLTLQLAWDLYHTSHSPAAREIQRIKRYTPLAHPTIGMAASKRSN